MSGLEFLLLQVAPLVEVQHPRDPTLDPLGLFGDRFEAKRGRGRDLTPLAIELPSYSIGVGQQRRDILPDGRVEPLHPDRRVLADPHATPAKSVGPRAEVVAVRDPLTGP